MKVPLGENAITRAAPAALVVECDFCGDPVIWLTLTNGRRRPFEALEVQSSSVDQALLEQNGFALRGRVAVPLNTVQRWPTWVLVLHRCSEYARAREAQREFVALWGETPPATPLQVVQRDHGARRKRP